MKCRRHGRRAAQAGLHPRTAARRVLASWSVLAAGTALTRRSLRGRRRRRRLARVWSSTGRSRSQQVAMTSTGRRDAAGSSGWTRDELVRKLMRPTRRRSPEMRESRERDSGRRARRATGGTLDAITLPAGRIPRRSRSPPGATRPRPAAPGNLSGRLPIRRLGLRSSARSRSPRAAGRADDSWQALP